MKHTTYKLGDNNAVSDISGFKYNASEMVYGVGTEKGLLMHISEFSPLNPQLYIQPVPEYRLVPKVRLEQPYTWNTNPTVGDLE